MHPPRPALPWESNFNQALILSFSPEESVIELSASLRVVREQRGDLCGTELNITVTFLDELIESI